MNIALSKASAAFGEAGYKELAVNNFKFIWSKFLSPDNASLHHTFKKGIAKYPAFLDDYAYLIKACIQLQEITSETEYLEKARWLTEIVIKDFGVSTSDFFYYTGKDQNDVIVRKQETYDGAIPSGNSVMAANLFYLSLVFDEKEWKETAVKMLSQLSELITKYPTSFANWACIFIDQAALTNEIAVVGKNFEALKNELLSCFIPNKILQSAEKGNPEFPLLSDKVALEEPLVYLCRNYTCQAPQKSADAVIVLVTQSANFNNNYNN